MKKPLDLKEYFADSRRNLPVKRGELQEILAYFMQKAEFAQAMLAMEADLNDAIRNQVEKERETASGIILPT